MYGNVTTKLCYYTLSVIYIIKSFFLKRNRTGTIDLGGKRVEIKGVKKN
jgi:hypothetical protein